MIDSPLSTDYATGYGQPVAQADGEDCINLTAGSILDQMHTQESARTFKFPETPELSPTGPAAT